LLVAYENLMGLITVRLFSNGPGTVGPSTIIGLQEGYCRAILYVI